MSELFPHESKLLTLNDPCLLDGCYELNASVIIETKIHTVEGYISYKNSKGEIKVKYNAVDAGYTLGYQLDNCEIESIRCFVCCDDRHYELESCDGLTNEALDALIGDDKPEGGLFVYVGDINEPDCKWRYSGFGNHLDVDNWIDEYGKISAQLENMPEEQLAQFVNWLSLVFEGNGISFNANEEDGKIVVTVIGDGYVGATSFVVSYEDGYIHYNPGDGSGVKTAMVIERGDGPPSEPYDWFIYINDITNDVYLNNDDVPMLLGTLTEPGDIDTCTGIINCIKYNIDNPPQQDKYALPELNGAPWIIKQVTYGADPTEIADFTDCDGTDLDDLVENLNNCDANPDHWTWVNNGGILTLCVPPGTGILTISYGTPTAVVNFGGVPTDEGDNYPDVCLEMASCIADRGLLDEHISRVSIYNSSANDTISEIESEFTGVDGTIKVLWVDAKGYNRESTRFSDGEWRHPLGKTVLFEEGDEVELYANSVTGSDITISNVIIDVKDFYPDLPEGIKTLILRDKAFSVGGACQLSLSNPSTGSLIRSVFLNYGSDPGHNITELRLRSNDTTIKINGQITGSGVTNRSFNLNLIGFE